MGKGFEISLKMANDILNKDFHAAKVRINKFME